MNDTTQTPTDQPTELDAIRARVDEIEKVGNDPDAKHRFVYHYGWEWTGDHWKHPDFVPVETTEEAFNDTWICLSRRLLELLDERDSVINEVVTKVNSHWCSGSKSIKQWPRVVCSNCLTGSVDFIDHNGEGVAEIKAVIESLAEAREKALEEAALVAENFPESKSEGCAEAIRSLKPQPGMIRQHGQHLLRDSSEGESVPGITHEEELGTIYRAGYIRIARLTFTPDELRVMAELIERYTQP